MILFVVFVPLINFLTFALTSTFVHRKQLALFAVAGMVVSLATILLAGPSIIGGEVHSVTLGTWAVSGLFEIN